MAHALPVNLSSSICILLLSNWGQVWVYMWGSLTKHICSYFESHEEPLWDFMEPSGRWDIIYSYYFSTTGCRYDHELTILNVYWEGNILSLLGSVRTLQCLCLWYLLNSLSNTGMVRWAYFRLLVALSVLLVDEEFGVLAASVLKTYVSRWTM